jgi:uncharacterized lipoprotein YmbA
MNRRALILLFLVAGCGIMKRPPNQFYSLDTVPPAAPVAAIGGVPIGVDGVELPPGLDQRGIVLRGADHKFEVRGTHQWASSLEEMVIHTLAFDLAGRLPNGMVVLPGQAKPAAMRSLYVTFEDLAPGPDGVFVLDARWTLGDMVGHERITLNTALEPPAIAAAMSQALGMFADRVVAKLR